MLHPGVNGENGEGTVDLAVLLLTMKMKTMRVLKYRIAIANALGKFSGRLLFNSRFVNSWKSWSS
jgi:hypothetical protein